MDPIVVQVTHVLSLLALGAGIGVLALGAALLARRLGFHSSPLKTLLDRAGKYALPLGFMVAAGGTLASLFYSNIAGFPPCPLCWWQRIFLYPQVIILGIAFIVRDVRAWRYVAALAICGAAVSVYHTYIQFGGEPLVPCGAGAATNQCAQLFFLEFGYITIPTMALTSFLLTIALMAAYKVTHNTNQ